MTWSLLPVITEIEITPNIVILIWSTLTDLLIMHTSTKSEPAHPNPNPHPSPTYSWVIHKPRVWHSTLLSFPDFCPSQVSHRWISTRLQLEARGGGGYVTSATFLAEILRGQWGSVEPGVFKKLRGLSSPKDSEKKIFPLEGKGSPHYDCMI